MATDDGGENGTVAPALSWFAARLDILRLVAFALVFLGHNLVNATFTPEVIRDNAAQLEVLGVLLFFVLSAYLIGRLLFMERLRTGRVRIRLYWARRILRIWPLYFAIVGLALVLGAVGDGRTDTFAIRWEHLPWWLVFLGNWAAPLLDFPSTYVGMFWTVCVEEQVYFLFPLLALLRRRALIAVLATMVVVGPAARALTVAADVPYPGVWNFTSSHLDAFAIGLAMAWADTSPRPAAAWLRLRALLRSGAGTACLVALTAGYVAVGAVVGIDYVTGWPTVGSYLAASIVAAGWIASASDDLPALSGAAGGAGWLGRRGYGLYAWHWPVLLIVLVTPSLTSSGRITPGGFVVSLAATLALAVVSYAWLERPFLRRRRRYQVVSVPTE